MAALGWVHVAWVALLVLVARASKDGKPNIVMLVVDDVGTADLSYLAPDSLIRTPHIDGLARQGVRLTSHYASPTCTPSRASLMTGRYAANTGLTFAMMPGSPVGLPDVPTLPQLLKDRLGYRTHMVGKWHLGHAKWKFTPVGKGFESHLGCFMWDIDSYTKQMFEHPFRPLAVDWGVSFSNHTYHHFHETRHATEAIAAGAVQRIHEHREQEGDEGKPLFLYVAFTAAHSPLQPMPDHQPACAHIPHVWRRQFCGMVVGLDSAVHNITTAATEVLGDNLIVVLLSDNGGDTWFGGLNTPFRGAKTTPLEGGVRVPAFVVDATHDHRYLGASTVGTAFDGMMHISDWLPTLVGLAGGSTHDVVGLDGLDMGNALRTGDTRHRDSMVLDLYFGSIEGHIFKNEDMLAVRKGRYKLVEGLVRDPHWYFESSEDRINSTDDTWVVRVGERTLRALEWVFSSGPFDTSRISLTHVLFRQRYVDRPRTYLFDIEGDPEERHNVAAQFPDVVADLRAFGLRYRDARPPQSPWWMAVKMDEFANTLTSGAPCNHPVSVEDCAYVHPWLRDDQDIATLKLQHGTEPVYRRLMQLGGIVLCTFSSLVGLWWLARHSRVQ